MWPGVLQFSVSNHPAHLETTMPGEYDGLVLWHQD